MKKIEVALPVLSVCLALIALAMTGSYASKKEKELEQRRANALDVIELLESGGVDWRAAPGGEYVGPYQISEAYLEDARNADPDLAGMPLSACSSPELSRRVVAAYMRRWVPEAWASGDQEAILRTHFGGPRGAEKETTLPYWERGRNLLER